MNKTTALIPFAGSHLDEARHVCAFFHGEEEEYRVLLPFITDGFACGDRVIHVINPGQCLDHLQCLAAAGVDTVAAQKIGQFELKANTDVYLLDGRFDRDRMVDVFEQLATGNVEAGFTSSGILCRMDWVV